MTPRERLKPLPVAQLSRLSRPRLLAYRNQALSLEEHPALSDYSAEELAALDHQFIWFKSDPRWQKLYNQILALLS